MIRATVSRSVQVTTLRVITAATLSSSACGATLGQRAHDIALRQDAGNATVGTGNDDGADPPLCQQLDGRGKVSRSARWWRRRCPCATRLP